MTSIDELLDDILTAEPSLAKERESLRPIVTKMVTARDGITVDDNFLFTLKQKLLHMPEQKTSRITKVLGYLLSASALGALVLLFSVPFLYHNVTGDGALKNFNAQRLTANVVIDSLKPAAFGSLMGANVPGAGSMMGNALSLLGNPAPGPMTVSPDEMMSPTRISEEGVNLMITQDKDWWSPPTYYRYTYYGELELTEGNGLVYRRSPLSGSTSGLTTAQIGPVDLGAFPDLEINYYSASQGDEGYNVSVDFATGSVNINQNDDFWLRSYEEGAGLSYVPSEEQIIDMAQDFLDDYGIDLTGYGAPIVNKQAYMALVDAVRTADPYAGNWMSVTYPLIVDGKEVHSTEGQGYGIEVSINLMMGEVSGATINVPTDLAASAYELTTDATVVQSLLERGGLYGYLPSEAEILNTNAKIIDIAVGEPVEVLIPHWMQDAENSYYALFVPALSFPILNAPEDYYTNHNSIVVPLVKDVIDSYQEPRYDIMPVEPAMLYNEIPEARGE